MNPFKPSNRHRPCPICQQTKPKCRTKRTNFGLPNGGYIEADHYFCMNLRDEVAGYKFTGETRNYLWGKYIAQATSKELSEAWKSKNGRYKYISRHQRKTILPKRKLARTGYQHLLTIDNRHREIERLLKQLALSDRHRSALKQRGFSSEEIDRYQFKSVSYQQALTEPISNHLAGIDRGGNKLNNCYSGILIPIRDDWGRYLGWQYRLDEQYARFCALRYLWPKTGHFSCHLQEYGELPISFIQPDYLQSSCIALVEGVGFKAILCAERRHQIVIGTQGSNFASSPQQLERYLKRASRITKDNKVLLYPDAGTVRNHRILPQIERVASLIERAKFQLEVAWWGQITKTQPDIDELEGEILEIISLEEFLQLSEKYLKYQP